MNRGLTRGKYTKRDLSRICGIVIHNTGPGPWRRHLQNPDVYLTPFDAALHIYEKLTDAGAHYVIDQEGTIETTCPHEYAAWHTGSRKSWPYRFKLSRWNKKSKYDWWNKRFPELSSPKDLCSGRLWRDNSCNLNTIGIEVVPHQNGKQEFSKECVEALEKLCVSLGDEYLFPVNKYHVVSHCEAHPISRTGKFGRYDTFETNLPDDFLDLTKPHLLLDEAFNKRICI